LLAWTSSVGQAGRLDRCHAYLASAANLETLALVRVPPKIMLLSMILVGQQTKKFA
jgi:hypothetical protein